MVNSKISNQIKGSVDTMRMIMDCIDSVMSLYNPWDDSGISLVTNSV